MSNNLIDMENDKEDKIKINTINEINNKNVEGTQELKENGGTFDFEPFLYAFEVSPFSRSSSTMLMTISSDRLHQDHTFGVIWLLFSEQKKLPNIFQLHWSLKFLEKLKNSNGTYTEDVNKCIQLIQDNLLKQYAKLGVSLKNINESIEYDKNMIITSTPKSTNGQKNIDTNMSKDLIESTDKDFNFQLDEQSFKKGTTSKENTSKLMSFTYDEMKSRGQVPCMEEVNYNYNVLFDIYTSSDSIEKFLKDLQIPKGSTANMSMQELLQFFNNIRNEYVETIKRQVDKIWSIENFMQNIDKNSFTSYITDDLIGYLNKLGDFYTEGSTKKLSDV